MACVTMPLVLISAFYFQTPALCALCCGRFVTLYCQWNGKIAHCLCLCPNLLSHSWRIIQVVYIGPYIVNRTTALGSIYDNLAHIYLELFESYSLSSSRN